MKFVGYGQDGEKCFLQRVHRECFLVHCEGNSESPFEFTLECDAIAFVQLCGFCGVRDLNPEMYEVDPNNVN